MVTVLYATDLWKKTYPGASVGCMVLSNVFNPEQCEVLENSKRKLETELRTRFLSKEELSSHRPIMAYSNYYKRYTKSYHVLQQLESVVFKGKSIPCVAGLVEAMFMAELKNCLLTAGHDYAALKLPLKLDVAVGNEKYIVINGKEQVAKQGDMMIADTEGVISSIIHGPDSRTRILPDTRKAVFMVYAPPGISKKLVLDHLSDIHSYVKLISSNTEIELQKVYPV
jgi:DNA/RNA-binding domain of Phe-tRNA-synthetase-like protein